MSALTSRINEVKNKRDIAERIAAKLASGKFSDTGATYTPAQATADATNPDLRLTARIDGSGNLNWSK